MKREWYVSFHGGAESGSLNNIHVYSQEGRELRRALNRNSLPPQVTLRELRSFTMGPDGAFYVVNAYKEFSQILRFHGQVNKQEQHDFCEVFVQYDKVHNPGLVHPFNAVFDPEGHLYVTSQDTSVTLRYYGPESPRGVRATAMPLPQALVGATQDKLHPGTFCASAKQVAHGLVVVRETLFFGGLLYVADRDADCVRKYDASTAAYRGEIAAKGLIDKPIHLAVDGDVLYIGNRGNESVVKCDLRTEMVSTFIQARAGGLNNPAGLALGGDGYFYIASRGTRQILRYRLSDGQPDRQPFVDKLEDDPEFIEPMFRK